MVDPSPLDAPPTGTGWTHEIKWDGYRAQAHLQLGKAQVFTRRGNDWTERFSRIAGAVAKLYARSAILDGEVVAIDSAGRSDFHELRRQLGLTKGRLTYQIFDLLWHNGEDLRSHPLWERKARLQGLLIDAREPLSFVTGLEEEGGKVFRSACGLGLEGIVSKRIESAYRAGRSHDWFKVKCEVSETFAIVGYRRNDNDRIEGLYLGRADGETWRYAGQVEHGISTDAMAELERRLPPLETAKSPLVDKPRGKRGAKWTRPEIYVEVVYPNRTDDGRLRHPRFKGLRDDMVAVVSKLRAR